MKGYFLLPPSPEYSTPARAQGSLSAAQQEFLSEFVWSLQHNWRSSRPEYQTIMIRTSELSAEQATRMLFLFPDATPVG